MSSFLTSVVAIVISVVLSGFVAWLLDRRKERRSSKKYDADRKTVIDFLRKLPSMQQDQQKLNEFFDSLGRYRGLRISDALSTMRLCKLSPTSGAMTISVWEGFHASSDADIKQMISDVEKGVYDDKFESNP